MFGLVAFPFFLFIEKSFHVPVLRECAERAVWCYNRSDSNAGPPYGVELDVPSAYKLLAPPMLCMSDFLSNKCSNNAIKQHLYHAILCNFICPFFFSFFLSFLTVSNFRICC